MDPLRRTTVVDALRHALGEIGVMDAGQIEQAYLGDWVMSSRKNPA